MRLQRGHAALRLQRGHDRSLTALEEATRLIAIIVAVVVALGVAVVVVAVINNSTVRVTLARKEEIETQLVITRNGST